MVCLKRGAFELEAESRPSKRARALSADGDIRNAAAANIDKDPTTPRRGPSANLQHPSTTDLPNTPHSVFDDSEHPWPEGQYHPGIVLDSDETSLATPPLDEDPASPDIPTLHRGDDHEEQDRQDDPEEDEFGFTGGYETDLTSITSSALADHSCENGRRYQNFRNGPYPIPNDDEELSREDMKHAMLIELCYGQLFLAPIGEQPHKILDVGTGSGMSGK